MIASSIKYAPKKRKADPVRPGTIDAQKTAQGN